MSGLKKKNYPKKFEFLLYSKNFEYKTNFPNLKKKKIFFIKSKKGNKTFFISVLF